MTDVATTELKDAQRDQEYVVAGNMWWYRGASARARALPWAIDDVTMDFGDDLYERMLTDSRIAACDILLRAAILEDGVNLSPAVDEEGKDGYEQATELVGFCEENLDDLETSLDDVLWDMLGCLSTGSRVAEITYHPFDTSPQPGRAMLRSLAVKPREAVAFVVDPYYRVLGMLGRQVGSAQVLAGALVDVATNESFIPREKFAVSTFRPKNNDPRGSSDLRAAYNPWWLKQQTWQEFLKYLAQFASPSIVGKTSEKAPPVTNTNTGVTLSAVEALLERLLAFQNGTALAVPFGYDIELLFSQGEGKAFLNAFQLYNAEITIAITTQVLATSEGEHASRAQAGVHQDALDTLVKQAKRSACRMLRRDVLRNLVRYNFGDAAAKLTPKVSLGETEATDIAKLITAFAQLQSSGYIHPSQQAGIDRQLNLPPRVITEAEQNPPPAPAPSGGQPGGEPGQQQNPPPPPPNGQQGQQQGGAA